MTSLIGNVVACRESWEGRRGRHGEEGRQGGDQASTQAGRQVGAAAHPLRGLRLVPLQMDGYIRQLKTRQRARTMALQMEGSCGKHA